MDTINGTMSKEAVYHLIVLRDESANLDGVETTIIPVPDGPGDDGEAISFAMQEAEKYPDTTIFVVRTLGVIER